MKLFYFLIIMIVVSCKGNKKATTIATKESKMESSYKLDVLLQESDSNFDQAETMVIRDSKRLTNFYLKLNKTRKPGLPVPKVDFSKELIVVQCMGEQKGMGIPVLRFLKETNLEVVLNGTVEKSKEAKNITTNTAPFCVYKMPVGSKKIVVELISTSY